jgi:hypothetical protein
VVGFEPTTYRLQDAQSTSTMAATSDFAVYSDRSGNHSGSSGRQFVSQAVSRWFHRHYEAYRKLSLKK